jgi:SAM-dependent methyltransferase
MLTPSWRRFQAEQRKFDSDRGIATGGLIFLDDLDIASPNAAYGGAYQATAAGEIEQVLRELGLDYPSYTFIDLGCGLGRPVFAAADFPFRRIVGVEFAPDLHALAIGNLQKYRCATRQCADIEFVCMDCADYVFPEGNLVLFLFNPFQRPVMETVLANLERSLAKSPRRALILYRWPSLREMFDKAAFLRPVLFKHRWAVYETREASRPSMSA